MKPLFYTIKGRLMNTVKKYFIYLERRHNNQINDRHTVHPNAIFDSLLHIHPDRCHPPPQYILINLSRMTFPTSVLHQLPDHTDHQTMPVLHYNISIHVSKISCPCHFTYTFSFPYLPLYPHSYITG
jgi:hypothetical protein